MARGKPHRGRRRARKPKHAPATRIEPAKTPLPARRDRKTAKGKSSRRDVIRIGGATAGFDAFRKFVSANTAENGVELGIQPHFDPAHNSLVMELRARKEDRVSPNGDRESVGAEAVPLENKLQRLNAELVSVHQELERKVAELDATGNDLANLLNCTELPTIFLDAAFHIKRFTSAATKLFSLLPGDLGRPIAEIAAKVTDNDLIADARDVLQHHTLREKKVTADDGAWFLRRIAPFRTLDGRVAGVVITYADITQRKQAAVDRARFNEELRRQVAERTQALRKSESELRAIVNTAADAVITINEWGIIQWVNAAAERIFGYTSEAMTGQNIALLIPPPHREAFGVALRRLLETGQKLMVGKTQEVQGQRKDGGLVPLEIAVSEVVPGRLFAGVLRDISRRRDLEREVMEIATLEQQYIGQELHDSAGQELTGLALMADALTRRLQDRNPAEAELATRITTGLGRVHELIRAVARGLVPVEMDSQGLRAALDDLMTRVSQEAGVQCAFHCEDAVLVKSNVAATHIFRIAQEAVSNSLRHGRAGHIDVTIGVHSDMLILKVQDDGMGMPVGPTTIAGLGMRILQHRAAMLGGTLQIMPCEPQGTLVVCTIPREAQHD